MNKSAVELPGIERFCNRWCEQCLFTNNCSLYRKIAQARLRREDQWLMGDLPEFFASFMPQVTDYLSTLDRLSHRYGNQRLAKLSSRLIPPSSFPLTERSAVLMRRLVRLIEQSLKGLELHLHQLQATYESLGQVTISTNRLTEASSAIATLVWYRQFLPARLHRVSAAVWLSRREQRVELQRELYREAFGQAVVCDQAFQAVRDAATILAQIDDESAMLCAEVISESQLLAKSLEQLTPGIRREQNNPLWWVSYGTQQQVGITQLSR